MALAALLEPLTGAIVALNLAQVVVAALGGVLTVLALRRLGLAPPAAMLGGASFTMPSIFVTFAGCGQFENLAGFALALGLWALAAGGWRGVGAAFLASLLCAFSSPYQSVVLAILLLAGVILLRPRRALLLLLAAALAAAPAARYYGIPFSSKAVEMGPGPAKEVGELVPAQLFAPLLLSVDGKPQVRWQKEDPSFRGVISTLRGSFGTLFDLDRKIGEPSSPEFMHRVYLGVSLAFFALLGLAARPRSRLVWLALGLGLLSLALAMGRSPSPIAGLVWPWAWTSRLAPLRDMASTYRFAVGAALALSLLAALGPDRLYTRRPVMAWILAGIATLVVALDGLSMGPFKVPLPTFETRLAAGYAALPAGGGVLDLPIQRYVGRDQDPFFPTFMAAFHGHPVAFRPASNAPDFILALPLVKAADGRAPLDDEGMRISLGDLRTMGFSYLAVHTSALPQEAPRDLIGRLQAWLGPADAVGDGVMGWRLDEREALVPGRAEATISP
jgi:hypothetical protein